MTIPQNIQREHAFQGRLKTEWEGVPAINETRKYAMVYEGHSSPVKYVISLVNLFINGEVLDPNNFNSIFDISYLRKLEFETIKLY